MELLGEYPDIAFKGSGFGRIEASGNDYINLIMKLDARIKGGRKLSFHLVAIHIDHTNAGFTADEIQGDDT